MKQYCSKCKQTKEVYLVEKSSRSHSVRHIGTYCSKCNSWIKWISRSVVASNELTVISNKTLF